MCEEEITLYLHFPWCIRKCSYCDFNSYPIISGAEEGYYETLVREIQYWSPKLRNRTISSLYWGGGTPTLLGFEKVRGILDLLRSSFNFKEGIEQSIEGNPVTFDYSSLSKYRSVGFNRFSVGIQSFDLNHLKILGRLNSEKEGEKALLTIKKVFDNFNIDLIYGLPGQEANDALVDLQKAVSFKPQHLSWYQLTLKNKRHLQGRRLPDEETIWSIEQAGRKYLLAQGFEHYEVSSYALPGKQCKHNLNYWQYKDYLAMGAGAHGKITESGKIFRYANFKNPHKTGRRFEGLKPSKVVLEFFLNRFRLYTPLFYKEFLARTGLSLNLFEKQINKAKEEGFITCNDESISLTERGKNFLDELLLIFV